MIVCMCPMCQLNMDGYQGRVNGYFGTEFKLPIMYFTQMLGIAFGLEPKKLGFGKELVAALPVLKAEAQRTTGGKLGESRSTLCVGTPCWDARIPWRCVGTEGYPSSTQSVVTVRSHAERGNEADN